MLTRLLPRGVPCVSRRLGSSFSSKSSRRLASTSITYSSTTGYPHKLQAAILDWSGTCADIFVIAPAVAFVEVFEKHKVTISMQEARGPMGLRKDWHLAALTQQPAIRQRWNRVHGRDPTQADVDAMFKDFVPMQLQCLPRYTGLIDGTAETVNTLRSKYHLKIGNTTGFQRVMVDVLLADAAKQGYVPDVSVAGDEVEFPRPYPFMVFENMKKLGISPVHSVVKVDDTVAGVGEGLNAGTWSVAITDASNYMDISTIDEWEKMPEHERERRRQKSREILLKSGAHYVIPTIRELPGVVEAINARLARGDRP